ncbi:hypothetical protein ACLESO_48720 [Pyxidicoccus sp. 3LG]
MAELLEVAVAGPVAGLAGGVALRGVASFLYDRTRPEVIEREQQLESREPFIILARKVAGRLGASLPEEREAQVERAIAYGFSAATGLVQALVARRWRFGWLTGGVLFGTLFWALEDEGMGPLLGLVGDNRKYPWQSHARGLAAHIAFGVVSGAVGRLLVASLRQRRA